MVKIFVGFHLEVCILSILIFAFSEFSYQAEGGGGGRVKVKKSRRSIGVVILCRFGAEVMDTVVAWTKSLCLNMPQNWIAVNDGDGKYSSDDISNRLSSWSVLDIGTGNGLLLQELAKIGYFTDPEFSTYKIPF